MKILVAVLMLLVLAGCVNRQRDHFYILDPEPAAPRASRTSFDRQITLRITVPSLVDRGEMVITTPQGVAVLDHERWGAPLADLVTSVLSRDIEQRRNDIVVLPRPAAHANITLTTIAIDVDQVIAQLGAPVKIETHWRITDTRNGKVSLGRDTFIGPTPAQSFTEIAVSMSFCVGLLADRLVAEIPE